MQRSIPHSYEIGTPHLKNSVKLVLSLRFMSNEYTIVHVFSIVMH